MTTPTPEQLAKLPKWAQEHVRDLERQRDNAIEAKRERDAAIAALPEFQGTNTFLVRGIIEPIPLPKDALIRFKTGDDCGDYIEVGFDLERSLSRSVGHPNALSIRSGGGALVVPDAHNALHIDQNYDY